MKSSATNQELDELISKLDPIAVGCSVMTAPEIVDFIRLSVHVQNTYNKNQKKIPVIWGGMHPTIVPKPTVDDWFIDLVISGEAETTFPLILSNYYLNGEWPETKLVQSRTPPVLDKLRPNWENIDITKFLFPESYSAHVKNDGNLTKQNIFYYLLTSRGCAYKCQFCWERQRTSTLKKEMAELEKSGKSISTDLTWRAHSFSWIKSQLDYLEERLHKEGIKIDGIGFWDDMMPGMRPEHRFRIRDTFDHMKDRKFGYLFEARADHLIKKSDFWGRHGQREADMYKFLAETGCLQVFVGTESADQETLNKIVLKGTRVKDYWRLVELSRTVGVRLRFSMIVGFPGEGESSINNTLDMIEALKDEPMVSVSGPKLFTPYPGTELYSVAVKKGFKVPQTTLEWSKINRYTDYTEYFPWMREYGTSTLTRINSFFEEVDSQKRRSPEKSKVDRITELVRTH
jgi:radical SAM superfamily enzyme YgiQ (UPF0313 family)